MILETQRLILRKPKKSDWKDIVEGLNDKETAKNLSHVKHPFTKGDAEKWILNCQRWWRKKEKEDYKFFIELKEEKKVIGALDITKINKKVKKCFTGSWLNKKYRRKAYMTEAKIAVNNFAFSKLKMRKMETSVFSVNEASIATQKTMGYKKEGYRKQSNHCISTNKYHDQVLFGLLKKEWKARLPIIKKKLQQKIKRLENKK